MATTLEILNAAQIGMLLNPPMVNLMGVPNLPSNVSTYFALPLTTRLSMSGNITWSSSTNPSRVTITVPGTYAISGSINWPGSLGTNDGRAQIQINGTNVTNTKFNSVAGSPGNFEAVCAGAEVMNAGDYLEVYANQNSGATITLTSFKLVVNLISLSTS